MLKIITLSVITLSAWLYMRVGILLTYEKDLHDHHFTKTGGFGPNTSLTPPLFFYCNACSKPVELSDM